MIVDRRAVDGYYWGSPWHAPSHVLFLESSRLNWPEISVFPGSKSTFSQGKIRILDTPNQGVQPKIGTFPIKKSRIPIFSGCFLPPAATGAPGFVGRLESWCSTSQAREPGYKPVVDEINPRYMLLNRITQSYTVKLGTSPTKIDTYIRMYI